MRIDIEQGDYNPLIYIRAFRGDTLIYRRLIRKEQEAEVREYLHDRDRHASHATGQAGVA